MTATQGATSARGVPTKHVAAGVIFTDDAGRVLLLQPEHRRTWEIPGGLVEAGESPRVAARRKVREELGIDPFIGSLLVIDWVPPSQDGPDGLRLIYDGGTLESSEAAAIHLARGELRAYGFVDMGSAVGLVSGPLERRIWAALRAKQVGRGVELEDGRPTIARELSLEE